MALRTYKIQWCAMKTPVKSSVHYVSTGALKNIIPKERPIVSLLLFSGQIECDLALSDYDITAFTNRWANYEFWECILKDPYTVAELADGIHKQLDPQLVYMLQDNWVRMKDQFYRSALYFVLNRYSFEGTVSHGSFNSNNYSPICSRSLINFYENNELNKLKIKYYKAEKYYEALEDIKDSQILLLPVGKIKLGPLNKQTHVGHEMYDMDYGILKRLIYDYNKDFVIVFKYNRKILKDFNRYNIVMVDAAGNPTMNMNTCHELIVHNIGVS